MSYALLFLLNIMGHTDPIPVAVRRVEQLENPVVILGVRGIRGSAYSSPQETMDEFVRNASPALSRFTQETGWEACAQVCKNEQGQFAWRATTSQSHVFCLAIDVCPNGYITTEVSVHTHPGLASFQANQADANAMRADGVAEGDWLFSGNPIGFSEPDLLSAPGYLVEPGGRILFHEGRKVRIVWPGEPLPAFSCMLTDPCKPLRTRPSDEGPAPALAPAR